jgi:NADPH:quinone reductase-like Zn-dependent oxidoreductase
VKAIRYREYGSTDVLEYVDVETPVPGATEVLIRVRAAAANPLDWHFMRGRPYLVRLGAGPGRPKDPRLGVDVAGVVTAVGRDVTRFKPGDAVFGGCRGAFAEYGVAAESALTTKPDSLSFEQAACLTVAGITALQGLRRFGQIQAGQQVLINGAAGGVGTFAVQIAKACGATVTGVCSTRNVEMLRSIGADRVIDYAHEDFTQDARRYDLLLDCVGNRPLSACRRVLMPGGTYVAVGGPDGRWIGAFALMIRVAVLAKFVKQRLVVCMVRRNPDDLATLRELVATGKVTPVIDRTCTLSEVPEAIRYLEAGHARGKVVITVAPEAQHA